MISNIKTSYKSLCELFNFSKENTADINKKLLLEMAKNGEDKPNYKTKLGCVLSNYRNKSGKSYDPIFTNQIIKLRRDWFIGVSETSNQNKKLLLKIAKNKKGKPNHKTKLGRALVNYTNKLSKSYDPIFTNQIRKLIPDWFVTQYDVAKQKKEKLLEMAKNGEDRPNQKKSKLGCVLSNYTNKSRKYYDPIFTKQIRKLRPDWFKK